MIKKYNEYNNIDEKYNEWLLSILMFFNIISYADEPKVGVEKLNKKEFKRTIKKTYDNDYDENKEVQRLLKRGWNVNSIKIDTIWEEIINNKPDSIIETKSIKIDNGMFFKSGFFDINQNIIDSITYELENMLEKSGLLLSIDIVSSTDKMPISPQLKKTLIKLGYTPDNQGLSKARSKSIQNFLMYDLIIDNKITPIDEKLINITNLYEQGEYDDQKNRYVYININYLVRDISTEDSIDKTPITRNTYYFDKVFKSKIKPPKEITTKKIKKKIKYFKPGKCYPW